MRGLLAEDGSTLLTAMSVSNGFLLTGLPGSIRLNAETFKRFELLERFFQWHARLSFPSQLRDSWGITPPSASLFPD